MIIKNDFRSVNEMLDQLQAQLLAERAQHAFNVAGLEKQIAILLKELAEARLELGRRDSRAALVNAPSASAMTHNGNFWTVCSGDRLRLPLSAPAEQT